MKTNEIATVQDILNLENKLVQLIANIKVFEEAPRKRFLRTKNARELLNVSDNKLRSMRDNGEIPYSFIGGTYYYPEDEIINLLKENTIKQTK